jgi:hypothetical protein
MLQAPRPHGRAVVHDGSSMGAGELKCFKKKKIKKKLKIKIFFSKKFQFPLPPTMVRGSVALQSPRPHGRAVVHEGSSVGAGRLKCFKNFIYFILFYFILLFYFSKKIQSPLPRQSRRARWLLHGGGGIGMQQSYQPKFLHCLKHFNPC